MSHDIAEPIPVALPAGSWRRAALLLDRMIGRAAEAKLAAIGEQIRELAQLQCRLRRLVQVCERGNSDDCVTLHLGEMVSCITVEGAAP